ncbi:MAG: PKD domain-containing protein, partial [Bacteroidia bacterium]|nr:PKD domain-containing protein [Bacteroidia bacterium]
MPTAYSASAIQFCFVSSVSGGISPYTYLWSFGDGETSTTGAPVHLYDLPGIYNISLIVTDSAGCSDTTELHVTVQSCYTIYGHLYENAGCGGMPVQGYEIALINETMEVVASVTPAITGSDGNFAFSYFEIINLDSMEYYSFATADGFELQQPGFKTLAEWMADENIELVLADINEQWIQTYDGPDSLYDVGTAIDLDGNIYVGGITQNLLTDHDYIVIKYDPQGN